MLLKIWFKNQAMSKSFCKLFEVSPPILGKWILIKKKKRVSIDQVTHCSWNYVRYAFFLSAIFIFIGIARAKKDCKNASNHFRCHWQWSRNISNMIILYTKFMKLLREQSRSICVKVGSRWDKFIEFHYLGSVCLT